MLDLYMQQSRLYLDEISAAVTEDSQDKWQDRCHKMKGAAGSIGLKQLHAKLVVAEKFTEGQNQKRQLLTEILALNDSAVAAFKSWLEQL
ncbi:Hpt domain-containing protein [Thalassomonas viridans]|uniref:Hpt domain-containing protein n=2 Tax=Thalassomonas viridans TaxID=137584 RepID=A0AAE9Z7X7_9GAMM|nr:Hpt domain-containing protein [Thalassomonas viridans]